MRSVDMIKSKALKLSSLFLLVLALPSVSFTQMVEANFVFPPSPPLISFKSPVNTTYSQKDVNITVEFWTYKTGYPGAPDDESLRKFLYSLDEEEFQPMEIINASIGQNPGTEVYFYGLIRLHELNEGRHNLTVRAIFDYRGWFLNTTHISTSNAYFKIETTQDNGLLSNLSGAGFLLPLFIIAVPVAISSLLLFRRYRRTLN
jgi:hypothetical protein